MTDIAYKSTIGTGGFIATIELGHINELSRTGRGSCYSSLYDCISSQGNQGTPEQGLKYDSRTISNARRGRKRLRNEDDRSAGYNRCW